MSRSSRCGTLAPVVAREIEIRALETSDHDAVVKLSLRAWAPNYASMKSVKRAALGLALTDYATEWLRAGMQVAMIGTGGDGGHASVSTSSRCTGLLHSGFWALAAGELLLPDPGDL